MTYRTKQEIFAAMIKEANKTEAAAIYYTEQGHKRVGADLSKKAMELFQKANEYSIRWNVR